MDVESIKQRVAIVVQYTTLRLTVKVYLSQDRILINRVQDFS